MKKLYALFLLLFPLLGFGQTVTTADLPYNGQAFFMGTDSTYVVPMLPGGSGASWDYSGLQNLETDTVGFGPAAGTPYASSFPAATLCGHKIWTNDYSYFHGNSSGFYIDGFANLTTTFAYIQPSMYFPVPLSYGNTVTNYGYISIDTVYLSQNVRVRLSSFETFNADGSGTLILPSGTFNNVLRTKETILVYDSMSIDIGGGIYVPLSQSAQQTSRYMFMLPGHDPVLLLSLEADSLGNTTSSSSYFITSFNGISSPVTKAESVYPNPAASTLNLSITDQLASSSLEVFDENGKLILKKENLTQSESLPVANLANGTYYYQINTAGKLRKGSFVVNH
ncbi:MAG: T9SS type A sorting domain-containing protein [Bacteroidia bacterium]